MYRYCMHYCFLRMLTKERNACCLCICWFVGDFVLVVLQHCTYFFYDCTIPTAQPFTAADGSMCWFNYELPSSVSMWTACFEVDVSTIATTPPNILPIVMFVGFRFAFVKRFRKKQRIRRGGGEKQKEAAFRTWLNIACWRVMNLDLLEPQVDDIDLNVFTDWFHSYQWSRAPHPSAIQISWVCLRLSGGLWQGIHHGTTWSFHGKNAWEFLHQMGHM